MDARAQAVLLNGIPLLAVSALYLTVAAGLVPVFGRGSRRRLAGLESALALTFPFIGLATAIIGVETLIERDPLAGNVYVGLAAIVVAAVPPALILAGRNDLRSALTGARRARDVEERSNERERGLSAVARMSRSLAGVVDEAAIARILADEARSVLSADLAAVALVDEDTQMLRVVHAVLHETPIDWLVDETIPLQGEPSGLASAVTTREAFAVVDATTSPRIHRGLAERTGTRSAAFVPLLAADGVPGAMVVGSSTTRAFSFEELDLLQSLAAEAAVALERTRSAEALGEALERERLIGRITSSVRSELDLDALLNVAVREVGRALELSRCYIRLGGPIAAEWAADGFDPIGDRAALMTVATRAASEGRTIAVADVSAELDDDEREALLALGTHAVLAAPIEVHGERIAALGLHRPEPGAWRPGAIALAETVAREAGQAIEIARLVAENHRRLAEQTALLEASQALASELDVGGVIRRIVDELARLLGADAADCWILEDEGRRLRCLAVRGLPAEEVGRTIRPEGTLAEAIAGERPVLKRRFSETEEPPPSATYSVFAEVMDAPIAAGGVVRGVLGVCSLEHDRFDDDDLRLLGVFARLAGIALRNAEAYEERGRREQVQRGFFRIASVLGEALSTPETLDAVAQAATDALGGSAAAVLRPVGDALQLAGSHELPSSLRRLLERGTQLHAPTIAASGGHFLAAPDLRRDERFAEWRAAAAEAGVRSLLAVPLAERRESRGDLVVVFFPDERSFTDDDLQVAGHVAVAARGALERSEVYERERRGRAHAQQLAETSRRLARELDPDIVLDELARQVITLLDADGASVRLLEGDELVLQGAVGEGAADVLGTRTSSTARVGGDIIQSRAPVAISRVSADERHVEADPMLAAGGYEAYVGVPLMGPDGSTLGVLAALSARSREWPQGDIDALVALAGSAGGALSNAELYQQVALEKGQSEAILANVADGIVAVDRDGDIVLWNAAAERITGVPASESVGRQLEQALGRDLAGADTPATPGRLVPIRRGADEVWLSVSEAVMRDPSGAVAGRIFAFRDISDERAVEQMKSEFVSTVSHELRTPLTSIYGFAETMLREDVQFGEEERSTFLRYIASESERLTTIVDTLLSVARLETGDVSVRLAATDVGTLVSDVVRSTEAALGGNGHRFVADVPSEPLAAHADRERLRQVLSILLDNAVRYSPGGGTVTVAARRTDGTVEVHVTDEGLGIPAAELALVFRKFYRGEHAAAARGAGNTGLGLFIAEGLMEAMGGAISVVSEGKGSTFTLELPAATTEPRATRAYEDPSRV